MTHPIFWHEVLGIQEPYGRTFYATLVMVLLIGFALLANRRLAAAQASGDALIPDEGLTRLAKVRKTIWSAEKNSYFYLSDLFTLVLKSSIKPASTQ